MEIYSFPEGGKLIVWYGYVGRSYFVQVSDPNDPLKKWTWAPIIEGGNDEEISHEFEGTADKGFFRLKYTDQVPGPEETLDTADFDGDGLTNWDEINIHHTDPLNPDTDGDGFSDGVEVTAGTDALDPLSFPIKVIASMPTFQPGNDIYLGHSSGQPVILYLNQPLPVTETITSSWLNDLNGESPVPAAGTTIILPGRQAIAFVPTGNSFTPWAEDQETPPAYEIDFTTATTGLSHVMPFHKAFTTTTAVGSLDCGPWISITSPASDHIDVACDTILTAKWSEALNPATIIPANASLVPDGGNPVAISVGFDYGKDVNLLRIIPAEALAPATRYTVTLGTAFQNLTAKSHAQPVSWSFTTRPERPSPIVGAGPYVVAVSPSDFSFGISPPDSVSITFSEDMDPATLIAESIHLRAGNGADLPGTFTYNATTYTLVFQPSTAFLFSTYHTLILDLARIFNNATVESGDRKALQAAETFVFSTGNITGASTDGANGNQAPASIAPLCIHFTWATELGLGANSSHAAVIESVPGCSVSITLIAKDGGSRVETLPPNTDAFQVHESGPIAPATTVVITPRFVPGSNKHPDLTRSQVYILPSDATPPPGMTYLVLRTTPAVGENGAATVEYLGQFGGAMSLTAGWVQDGSAVRGPQSLYLVPVPIERHFGLTPLVGDIPWYLIEGNTAKALPGQKMNLRLEDKYLNLYGPAGVTLNNFSWTIPDKAFKDYVVVFTNENAATSGTLTALGEGDVQLQEAYYYWADSGVKDILVEYSVTIGSQVETAFAPAKVNVDKPISMFTTQKGVTQMGTRQTTLGPAPAFGFFPEAENERGIEFSSSVTTPAGWDTGRWNWVQLITSQRLFKKLSNGETTHMGDGITKKLDSIYPYAPVASPDWPQDTDPVASCPANGAGFNSGDTPSSVVFGDVRIENHESFETFLMFKPPGIESCYVPLIKVTWMWGGVASTNDNWVTSSVDSPEGSADPEGVECSVHPQWTANTTEDIEE